MPEFKVRKIVLFEALPSKVDLRLI